MHERPRAQLVAYGVALLATAASLLIRWPLRPVLGHHTPFMSFIPAVVLSAYLGGLRPGLLATLLSVLAGTFFLVGEPWSFGIAHVHDAMGVALFVLAGAIISGLCESLHRARLRIAASERRRADETLHETEERFRQLAEHIHEVFWMRDPRDDRFLYMSPGCEEVSGRTWQSFHEQPDSSIETIHPDDRDRALQALEQHRQGVFANEEFRIVRPDGSVRWIRSRAFPLKDQKGDVSRIAGLAEDITERKRAEEALRESEERFRGTFENAAIGIAHTDASGRFLRINEKFCKIVGYPREELLQKTFQEITYPDDQAASMERFTPLMRGESRCFGLEKRYLRKDGSLVWVELFVSLQRDAAGAPAYAIAISQDISERKRLEGELRQAKEAAEAANHAKDEFLANVSHEIRTPFGAILGMTELVLDTPLTPDQRQYLNTVKSAADNLLCIINDILDFSRIEAGKLELDPADFSLCATLGDTLRTLAVRAHRKGLELVSHVQADVPDALIGDAVRLRQVLLNLVGNAIKFTEEGEVVVSVSKEEPPAKTQRRKEDREGEAPAEPGCGSAGASPSLCAFAPLREVLLQFSIRDTGIGIPQARQEKIFRAFEQEDSSTTRKYGGTGLGLTIASRLAALMGGQITVESEPGRGSTFAFMARFGRQQHPPEQSAVRSPVLLRNLPVLVVDDNATNRRILEEWVRGWQMKPVAVADGMAAMDALWHGTACGRPYALVLLDARMPDTDGLTLAYRIRQRVELSATRIILLTSGDRPGDLARGRELRLDAHLLKPVQQQELLETISQVMSRANGGAPAPALPLERESAPAPVPAAGLSILVAEDNEFNALLLEQLLVRRGHRVRLANNGREALALAEEGGFDLLLLDVHMPELDGFQVIQAIREREGSVGGHLPVIALTARSRKEDRERCLAAGMDDFLTKPISVSDLWAAIDRVASARPVVQPADLLLGAGPDLLDPCVLLAACGGNAVILEKICQAFRAGLPDQLTAVQDALREGDTTRLREAAHKVCGMVAAFSTVAGRVASDLEDHAAQGQFEEARPLVGQLSRLAQDLMRAVDGLSIETLRQQKGPDGNHNQPAGS